MALETRRLQKKRNVRLTPMNGRSVPSFGLGILPKVSGLANFEALCGSVDQIYSTGQLRHKVWLNAVEYQQLFHF